VYNFLLKNKFYKLSIFILVLGCLTFALCNIILKKSEKTPSNSGENTLMLMDNTEKKYSNVKDIIAKYSYEDISALNTEKLDKNEEISKTKKIVLNMKSSINNHLLSIKQAKEQKEKENEKILKAQQEMQKKEVSKSSQPLKADTIRITPYERDLLERLVEAEAGGEPYEGKLAVVAVVINRLNSKEFPNTIHGVIYQKNQFSPVVNGSINCKASAESKRAVRQVVDEGYRSFSPEVVYFLNPDIATSKWIINNRTFVKAIGNHHFYK